MRLKINNERGMSLIELTVILVIISILVAVAMKSMTSSVEDTRRLKTDREMEALAKAIVGDATEMEGGRRSNFGYVGDVGSFPPNLSALVTNPGGYTTWNGPYIESGFSEDTNGYKFDEWGQAYSYSGGLTITSSGHGTPMVKKIADASSDYLLNSFAGVVRDASDSLPGNIKKDSVAISVTIPNGTGGTISKNFKPNAAGSFQFDSLPVGFHPLTIVYVPQNDTLTRSITILPRNKISDPALYKFSVNCFSGSGGCGSSIVTLRPNGSGSITNLTHSGCSANWQCVSESAADDDATYVLRADNSYAPETYALANPASSACAITRVTVWCRARRTQSQGNIMPAIFVGGSEYDGSDQALTSSYRNYSAQWATNPSTGAAWTWSQINGLEAGMRLRGQNGSFPARCTQVWVEVRY